MLCILAVVFLIFSCFVCIEALHECSRDSEGGWSIGFVFGSDPFNLHASNIQRKLNDTFPCVKNPILSCESVNDVSAAFVADPFLYFQDSDPNKDWYLFFEVKNRDKTLTRGSGQIGSAISTDQGQTWKYLSIVLALTKPPFKWTHLSYPIVFDYMGEYYMMPQSWEAQKLFKAKNFPYNWEMLQMPLSEYNYIDSTIVQYDGVWWMISVLSTINAHFLHVLYADSPIGPWKHTPHNCYVDDTYQNGLNSNDVRPFIRCHGDHPEEASIVEGSTHMLTPHNFRITKKNHPFTGFRPGGSIFEYNKKLFRMVQGTHGSYGDVLDVYEIKRLSKVLPMQEVKIPEFRYNLLQHHHKHVQMGTMQYPIRPGDVNEDVIDYWNQARMHHMDLKFVSNYGGIAGNDLWVGVMDGDSDVEKGGKLRNEAKHVIKSLQNRHELKDFDYNRYWKFYDRCTANRKMNNDFKLSANTTFIDYQALQIEQSLKSITQRNEELCFFSAASSNHYKELMVFILHFFEMYPCRTLYIYDLGFSEEEVKFLKELPNVHVVELHMPRGYFEYKACVFKPFMLLDIVDGYGSKHQCKEFFYGDTSIVLRRQFDELAFNELDRVGIVAESPQVYPQIEMTHPGMYEYFGIDRDDSYLSDYEANNSPDSHVFRLNQVQAGLQLVSTLNRRMRNEFYVPWMKCAYDNTKCLSPGGFKTDYLTDPRDIYKVLNNTVKIFRTHRDDQSAFTFLIDRFFGHGKTNTREVYLDKYAEAIRHTRKKPEVVLNAAKKLSCFKEPPRKS